MLMCCLLGSFSSFQKQVTGHPRHSPPFCSPAGALCAGGHCHSVQECSPAPPEYRVQSCSDSSSPLGEVGGQGRKAMSCGSSTRCGQTLDDGSQCPRAIDLLGAHSWDVCGWCRYVVWACQHTLAVTIVDTIACHETGTH